jgi:hypothetical protein
MHFMARGRLRRVVEKEECAWRSPFSCSYTKWKILPYKEVQLTNLSSLFLLMYFEFSSENSRECEYTSYENPQIYFQIF